MAYTSASMRKDTPDLAIARSVTPRPIAEVASALGLADAIEPYGRFKAKVRPEVLSRLGPPKGKYVVVTAINPTPLGEGKTVTTIGLGMAMNRIGLRTAVCIRQPSLGPVFGIKGGAAGGGRSQVIPMEELNLHLTGDNHAVSLAHNLLAAFIDNHLHHGNRLGLDVTKVAWRRVVDVSDRSLRRIVIGLDDGGVLRETGFDIAVASEAMAILALATSYKDLRERLGRITVGYRQDWSPVSAQDLRGAGAMAALLRDALGPNLLQTLEGTPAFVHCGPFGNIAHGNSSILADRVALACCDAVVTESGFGADCGFEKFIHVKCRMSGMWPDCAVLVASVRALKMHGGDFKVVAGRPLDPALTTEDLASLEAGCANLRKQIENVRVFGVPVVVAINRFGSDTERELELVRRIAREAGAVDAAVSEVWAKGGEGGRALAEAVAKACKNQQAGPARGTPKFLYELSASPKEKLTTLARTIYGARELKLLPLAKKKLKAFEALGWGALPICVAKTHLSLSDDPTRRGAPRDHVFTVRDVRASTGAGFLVAYAGEIGTMPGLPSSPIGEDVDITDTGEIVGLS